MKILNRTKNTCLASQAQIADTFISRMVGLIGRSSLPQGEALVIMRCNSIHMFFMRFAIDVLFLDKNDRVVALIENIRPFRLSPIFFQSNYCIELPVGTINESATAQGDRITIEQ